MNKRKDRTLFCISSSKPRKSSSAAVKAMSIRASWPNWDGPMPIFSSRSIQITPARDRISRYPCKPSSFACRHRPFRRIAAT